MSRLPSVAAWLAGAAMLAGALAPQAQAQTEETAMAVPRLAPFSGDGVALPRPLAAPDAAVLRRLFAKPAMDRAALLSLSAAIDPTSTVAVDMLGHVLAQRYLARPGLASAADLADWMARYPALPDAPAIALLRGPLPAPPRPVSAPPAPAANAVARNPALDATLRQRLHDGHFDAASRLVARTRGLSPAYAALLQAEQARALFTRNHDEAALTLATAAARRAGNTVALADYVAGLAAWRLHRHDLALAHFATAANAPIADAALRAAAGYWAARACGERGDMRLYRAWLAYAASEPRTFYGQIARHLSGQGSTTTELLGEAEVDAIAAEPAGLRAFALLQLAQPQRAETELRALAAARPTLLRPLMLVARRAGMDDLAGDLAVARQRPGGAAPTRDKSFMPLLRPSNGFLVDPALVYALTRIESNFDAAAVSAMGAEGLMQIMPGTAGAVIRVKGTQPRLHDPAVNLDVGQRYVAYLANHQMVAGDLIRLLGSYNSGPAAFARWSGDIAANGDPLLFIEAIPTDETRDFVQHALAFTWIYAARLHLPAPSLDALSAGAFPRASVHTLH